MRTLADRQHEQAKADADDRDLESRNDRRRREDARETRLKALAVRLVGMKPAALGRLGLDEELLASIATAQVIRSAPARNRQVNVVRQHLRSLGPGLDALLERIEAPRSGEQPAPSAPPARVSSEAERWLERLSADGDDALEALVAERPNADRQQLRQRMRELARARVSQHAPSIGRAEVRLREALGALLD
jgi:ribosome-associated protein